MPVKTDQKKITELLTRGVAEAIDQKHLAAALASGKKLRIKLGIDPTSPNLHLGRAVVLLKLRDFQELGHQVVFIVGDFTGTIGDSSDKESERPMLTAAQVRGNMKSYLQQAAKLLDLKKAEVYYNSKWLSKLGYAEICRHAEQFSLTDFVARENIKRRVEAGKRVSLREVLYPLMQGYDSIQVKADVELGGTDQRFNLLAGRTLQKNYGQPPQDILMTNLILGTDGRKMSSSWGNTINFSDDPTDMFGKVMSIPDNLIVSYFEHCTRVPQERVKEVSRQLQDSRTNPRDVKMGLAAEIVALFWGQNQAAQARKEFISIFQDKQLPSDMANVSAAGKKLIDVLISAKLAASKSEARRLLEQRGIKVDDKIAINPEQIVETGSVIQKGKRFFVRVTK